MPRLWQVSIRTAAGGEAAAARLLERVFGQTPAVYCDEKTGAITVSAYPDRLPEAPRILRAKLEDALSPVRRLRPDLGQTSVAIKPLRRENWAQSWKRHFHPIEIGRRLLIKPGWSRRRARPGQRVVILDPGLSFGTGHHPTTLFCLQQLARCRRGGVRQAFLDIGTGSGILAIAAAKLGCHPVVALDCDPEAIRSSRQNFRRNNVRVRLLREDLARLPLVPRRRYEVVCANLTRDLLIGQAAKIRNLLKPGGKLLVAGILRREFANVRKNFEQINLTLVKSRVSGEWKSGQFALLQSVPLGR